MGIQLVVSSKPPELAKKTSTSLYQLHYLKKYSPD